MVTGIGQCCWDYLAVVEGYPALDSKKEILCWDEQGGGPVATALVTLARLGAGCRLIGIVGDDDQGCMISKSIADEGIDIAGLITRPGAVSQRAFIAIEKESGLRTIFWQRPTGEPLRPDELAADFLQGSRFLLLDGLMIDASLKAAEEARRQQVPIILDAGRMRPGMIELAGISDHLVAGEQFFLDLGWDGCRESFMRLASSIGAPVVTVTLGRRGSFTWCNNDFICQEAFAIEAVDTTGAGDVFHGGYIYGLLQGWDIRDVISFASAIAALKCQHLGGRRGIPPPAEVFSFLEARTGKDFPSR